MLDYNPLLDFFIRFLVNLLILAIISLLVYYPRYRKKDYAFTFIIIGATIFVLSFMLSSINMELGLALGLFAIFGIMRYRTMNIIITDMTYLFFSITISVINSLASAGYGNIHLFTANASLLAIILILEFVWMRKGVSSITIRYEKIQLILPDRHAELQKDIEQRLGITVLRLKIGQIDFLRDTASVEVFYDARKYPHLADESKF